MNEFLWYFDFVVCDSIGVSAYRATLEVSHLFHKHFFCYVGVICSDGIVLNQILAQIVFEVLKATTASIYIELPCSLGVFILPICVPIPIALFCHYENETIVRVLFSLSLGTVFLSDSEFESKNACDGL